MKFKGNIYQSLIGLADSLDEHISEQEVALSLHHLAAQISPQLKFREDNDLGFQIEQRGSTHVLVYDNEGGCHPASAAEVALWEALTEDPETAVETTGERAERRNQALNRLTQFLYEEVNDRPRMTLQAESKGPLVDAVAAALHRAEIKL